MIREYFRDLAQIFVTAFAMVVAVLGVVLLCMVLLPYAVFLVVVQFLRLGVDALQRRCHVCGRKIRRGKACSKHR
jgi:uncharacterized membrane protein